MSGQFIKSKLYKKIMLFSVVVTVLISAKTVVDWIFIASTFLYRTLGDGHAVRWGLYSIFLFTFYFGFMTPKWAYVSVPKRFRHWICWILFIPMSLSLVLLVLVGIGEIRS